MRVFILLMLTCLYLTACGVSDNTTVLVNAQPTTASEPRAAQDPCQASALSSYRNRYSALYNRWTLTMIEAGNTKPADLQIPIAHLEGLLTDLRALKPPPCAEVANQETLQAMQSIIASYQNLYNGNQIGSSLTSAIDQLVVAHDHIIALPGTPRPTATPLPSPTIIPTVTPIPTNTPTATPTPSPTPKPRKGVIDNRNTQMFDSPTGITPIRTLAQGTIVDVFELQRGRLHIRIDDTDGWVAQNAVIIQP
jgi:hypothetical protein